MIEDYFRNRFKEKQKSKKIQSDFSKMRFLIRGILAANILSAPSGRVSNRNMNFRQVFVYKLEHLKTDIKRFKLDTVVILHLTT